MFSKITVQTNTTREEAFAEQKNLEQLRKRSEKEDMIVTLATAGLAIAWIVFAATEWANGIIPTRIEPYITACILVITSTICLMSQAAYADPVNSATHSYYTALDKGKIVEIEAWKISEEDHVVDMRIVQENENKEVFYTFIPNFAIVMKTDITDPVFDLDKKAFYIPYAEREMFVNAHS